MTTLLEKLAQLMPQASNTTLRNKIKEQSVRINGNIATRANQILNPDDQITLDARKTHTHIDPRVQCVFEDDAFFVINKASGLHSVDTTGGGCDNAANIVEHYLKQKNPKARAFIVHRLDRDTSGILLFAKSRRIQDLLVKSWNNAVLERAYIALVQGDMPTQSGTIDSYLYEDAHKIIHTTQNPNHPGALRAITHYNVLQTPTQNFPYTRLKLDLETGRTNQIRVHLQSIGYPILGDAKYGSQINPINRLALHALNLSIQHPITKKIRTFSAPPPF